MKRYIIEVKEESSSGLAGGVLGVVVFLFIAIPAIAILLGR